MKNGENTIKIFSNKIKLLIAFAIICVAFIFGSKVSAYTDTYSFIEDVQTDKIDAGLFGSDILAELNDDEYVLAISPRSGFIVYDSNSNSSDELSVSDLADFFNYNGITNVSATSSTLSSSAGLATGTEITLYWAKDTDSDGNTESGTIEVTVVLFGDVNGDGTICDANDIGTIKNALLSKENNEELAGVYRIAANVRYAYDSSGNVQTTDNLTTLNAFDIGRMVLKDKRYDGSYYDDKLSGTLVYESIYSYNYAVSKDNGSSWSNYNSFVDAVAYADTDATIIKALKDVELDIENGSNGDIANNQDITLDLNGNTVSFYNWMYIDGDLTIEDTSEGENGVLENSGTNTLACISLQNKSEEDDGEAGTITLNSGIANGMYVNMVNYTSFTINGGEWYGYISGGQQIGHSGTVVTVDGGYLHYDNGVTINHIAYVYVKDGTVESTMIDSDGETVNNYAISVCPYIQLGKNDGTISSTNPQILGLVSCNGDTNDGGGVYFYDGIIKSKLTLYGGTVESVLYVGRYVTSADDIYDSTDVQDIFFATNGTMSNLTQDGEYYYICAKEK